MNQIAAILQRHGSFVGVLTGIGLLFSCLPYLISLLLGKGFFWFADYDEVAVYLVVAAKSYFNHATYLADAIQKEGGAALFPWLQFVPFILVSKLLDGGLETVALFWRIFAGLSIPIASYVLFYSIFQKQKAAFALAAFILCDIGFNEGRPLMLHIMKFMMISTGFGEHFFDGKPSIYATWRIITPGLSLWTFFIYLATLIHAYREQSLKWIVLAGFAFGLLFHTYFYFWTAAGLSLALGMVIDYRKWKQYFQIGSIGLMVGLPNIILSSIAKKAAHPDWLPRSDKFISIGHFEELLIPKFAVLILILSAYWIFKYRRQFIVLWMHLFGSLLVTNHQIVTGLQIENFHWRYAWGPVCYVLILVLFANEAIERKWFDLKKLKFKKFKRIESYPFSLKKVVATALGFFLVTGLVMRSLEVTKSKDARELSQDYQEYRVLFHDLTIEPNATIAGSTRMVYLASAFQNLRPLHGYPVVISSTASNLEWDIRDTLSGYLSGLSADEFQAYQESYFGGAYRWGIWQRDAEHRKAVIHNRAIRYLQISTNPKSYVDRYNVHYVVFPKERNAKGMYLLRSFRKVSESESYELWSDL